jgi:mRNA interferase RelE/StbE
VGSYAIEIKPSARKELERLTDSVISRLVTKIESLSADPSPSGCRKLRGYKDLWRIRVGHDRVLYILGHDLKKFSVTRAAHWKVVYR